MLHSEIKKSEESKPVAFIKTTESRGITSAAIRIAAAIALLICGTFIGMIIHNRFQ